MTSKKLYNMEQRARRWVSADSTNRDNAIGEELLALDVLDLVKTVERYRELLVEARPYVLATSKVEGFWDLDDATKALRHIDLTLNVWLEDLE